MSERDRNAACNDEPAAAPFQELTAPGRNGDGTFAAGNVAALKHGGYSAQVRAGALAEATDEARAAVTEREAAIVADLGGPDAIGVLSRDAVARYVTLQLVEDWLARNIVAFGVLTPKGRQRAALNAFLQVSDRLTRLAQVLGLDRKPKPTTSPLDFIEGRA